MNVSCSSEHSKTFNCCIRLWSSSELIWNITIIVVYYLSFTISNSSSIIITISNSSSIIINIINYILHKQNEEILFLTGKWLISFNKTLCSFNKQRIPIPYCIKAALNGGWYINLTFYFLSSILTVEIFQSVFFAQQKHNRVMSVPSTGMNLIKNENTNYDSKNENTMLVVRGWNDKNQLY